ncbi:hypothetical protein LTR66_017139, partial [Elasticomyces elasticus]
IQCIPDTSMKKMMCRIEVDDDQGDMSSSKVDEPLGEPESPFVREMVEAKFLGLAAPVYGKEKAGQIKHAVYTLEQLGVLSLLDLVQ